MRVPRFIVFWFFILCQVLAAPALAQDFTIGDFASTIVVKPDSSLTVRERITVEFHRPRHGIYRELPWKYRDSSGETITTPTEIVSVSDGSGGDLKYKVSRKGQLINVRIGDPDKMVSGKQVYEIFYRVENALLFTGSHDELYWNVTGNYWQADIGNASCTVSVEGAESDSGPQPSCYTGRPGSTEAACTYERAGGATVFRAARRLPAGEGFTIAYGWPKGIVKQPSAFTKSLWRINLGQNWIFLLPFFSLAAMFSLWHSKGRDDKAREAITVMYDPPQFSGKYLSPAEIGTLIDETLDPRDITASIVGLAVRGYIRIEEKKDEGLIFDSTDYYLQKMKEPERELTRFEMELMLDLFGSGPGVMVSDLKNKFYKNIASLKEVVYSELLEKKYFKMNPDKVRQVYVLAAIGAGAAVIGILHLLAGGTIGSERIGIAGLLTGLPVFLFARFMPAKTRAGSAAYIDILGFEEFLDKAEKDKLLRMKDENLFSKYFPYALALNVADNWAKAFEGIYQQPPDWYASGRGFGTFHPASFSRSVGSAFSSMSSAIVSAPRGSGTGGSGSSGGGFGGGGGGSW